MKVTLVVAKVLSVFLGDPDREWYGLELMRETELPSGTLYPVLARMEAEGWLTSERETEKAHGQGRPRRRYYTLTELGRSAGAGQLVRVQQSLQPAPARLQPRLVPSTGLAVGRLA
ncbi:PadR family transcriptional regulator [Micromonospora globbae]|jgi:hypothetical protein|uniref:PadR family transcriptional regulator n=1 Tax=Micromonospora globbae TaxID=1894969 RepID=UPI00343402DE